MGKDQEERERTNVFGDKDGDRSCGPRLVEGGRVWIRGDWLMVLGLLRRTSAFVGKGVLDVWIGAERETSRIGICVRWWVKLPGASVGRDVVDDLSSSLDWDHGG